MRYIKLGSTGVDVSPIAIGAMTYGEPSRGHPVWSLGEQDSRPLIKHAVEAGINFFDTFGGMVRRGLLRRFFIAASPCKAKLKLRLQHG
jgi:predicted aldo/keto reductase-like oxidoreductase